MGPPPPGRPPPAVVGWETYWDRRETVELEGRGKFNVYCAGDAGPVVLCVHGGGYTGLTWSLVSTKLRGSCRVVAPDLRMHGLTEAGGDSGRSPDFSRDAMAGDVVALWQAMFSNRDGNGDANGRGGRGGGDTGGLDKGGSGSSAVPPATLLVGHSMGGALAVWAAAQRTGGITGLAGIVVIDVVEGTALAALPYMVGVLEARPSRFASREDAIAWALRSGTCKCRDAAAVSLPSQLVLSHGGAGAAAGVLGERGGAASEAGSGGGAPPLSAVAEDEEQEEEEEGCPEEEGGSASMSAGESATSRSADKASASTHTAGTSPARPPHPGAGRGATGRPLDAAGGRQAAVEASPAASAGRPHWVWRTPLLASQPCWRGWYEGLSDVFLALPVPKLLMLAGTDRLDKPLTIGQMQGKFQLALLPMAGHAVHEDEATRTAEALLQFIQRFRIGMPPLALPKAPAGTRRVLPQAVGVPHATPPVGRPHSGPSPRVQPHGPQP